MGGPIATSDGSKQSKRNRVSQACQPCRLKKSKCDGNQPKCSVCKSLGVDCYYNSPKKRGMRPGQVIALERRAILTELIVAFLVSRFPEAARSVHQFFSTDDLSLPFLLPGRTRDEAEEILTQWRKTQLSQWHIKTAARVDPALDYLQRFRLQFSNPDFSVVEDAEADNSNTERHARRTTSEPDLEPESHEATRINSTQPLPKDVLEQLDNYFTHTHPWLPFIDKYRLTAFVRSHLQNARSASQMGQNEIANLALSWSVIAYSSLQTPKAVESSRQEPAAHEDPSHWEPEMAAREALRLIPAFKSNIEQESLQALVLLSLYHFEQGTHEDAWLLIGVAGRLTSGLNPEQHSSSGRRRTALAAFVVEGIMAASLGRKPQCLSASSRGNTELETEGWEEWSSWGCTEKSTSSPSTQHSHEPFRALSTFNQAIRLVNALNDSSLSPPSEGLSTTKAAVQRKVTSLFRLVQCIGDSYPFLSLPNAKRTPHIHTLSLHCLYWTTRCMLHYEAGPTEDDKQTYDATSRELANTVCKTVTQYLSIYPPTPAPLPITAVLMVSLRLLSVECELKRSLKDLLNQLRRPPKLPSKDLEPTRRSTRSLASVEIDLEESCTKRAKHDTYATDANMDPFLLGTAPLSVDSTVYVPPLAMPFVAASSRYEGTSLDSTAMDQSETMSALDLTVLDAAVWNDDLYARNLGYMGDLQMSLDPSLGNIFDEQTE